MITESVVLDNVVPIDTQEEIKNIMFNTLFPWFFRNSLSLNCDKMFSHNYTNAPGFAHVFCNDDGLIGNFFEFLKPIVDNSCSRLNVTPKVLTYGRTFLQMPVTTHSGLTIPHIDDSNREHLVLVYYVLDSDGDTVLFDRKYDFTSKVRDSSPLLENDIVQRVTPRQGSVLAFNGNTYHANILPKQHMRCIINFNLLI